MVPPTYGDVDDREFPLESECTWNYFLLFMVSVENCTIDKIDLEL